MKKILMEVFRTGKHTDAAGNTKEWTESDLDKIVTKFQEAGEEVPATIGHPETDSAPAWAWFKKVYRKGKSLWAEMDDIVDEFGEMLQKNQFKNRSIALRPDLSLRHIAFLGAAAPAVKGMEKLQFSFASNDEFTTMDQDGELEFSEISGRLNWMFRSIGRLFQGLRDRAIEKDGLEKADQIFPQYEIDSLKNSDFEDSPQPKAFAEKDPTTVQTYILSKDRFKDLAAVKKWLKDNEISYEKNPGIDETEDSWRIRQKDPGLFDKKSFRTKKITNGVSIVVGHLKKKGEKEMSDFKTMEVSIMTNEELTAKVADLEKKMTDQATEFAAKEAKFSEDLAAQKKRADDAEAKVVENDQKAKDKEFSDWLDAEIKDGRILPANRDMYLKTMKNLDGQEAMDFSENGQTKKVTPLELFKAQVSAGGQQVSFGEAFGKGAGTPANAGDHLKKAAEKICSENKGMTFSEGFRRACDENPEIVKLYEQGK